MAGQFDSGEGQTWFQYYGLKFPRALCRHLINTVGYILQAIMNDRGVHSQRQAQAISPRHWTFRPTFYGNHYSMGEYTPNLVGDKRTLLLTGLQTPSHACARATLRGMQNKLAVQGMCNFLYDVVVPRRVSGCHRLATAIQHLKLIGQAACWLDFGSACNYSKHSHSDHPGHHPISLGLCDSASLCWNL